MDYWNEGFSQVLIVLTNAGSVLASYKVQLSLQLQHACAINIFMVSNLIIVMVMRKQ